MALRPVSGVLARENEQTGDGRVIAPNATTWVDPPLPLAWLVDGDQHVDLVEVAPSIGTIDTIGRTGDDITFTGTIDDAIPEGAEALRRMTEGSATMGNRFGVSIDPDDYACEIIVQDTEDEGGMLILASGHGAWPTLTAAAGDPDPGEDGGDSGVVVMEDSADSVLMRFTALRIRGATLCAVPAFAGAYVELADEGAAAAEQPAEPAPPAAGATTAAGAPTQPPRSWFADPAFGSPDQDDRLAHDDVQDLWACPITVTDDGRIFGHLAPWEQCHIGYPDACVSAPPSMSGYAYFLTGEVVCEGGERVAVGQITLSGGHPDRSLSWQAAVEHYDDTNSAIADVVCGEDEYGIWIAGALRPGATEEQLRVLRASALSGDWRPIGGQLELVAALCVNVQGFPIPRREATVADGRQLSLVAAGVAPMARIATKTADPDQRRMTGLERRLAAVEAVTAPLRGQALEALKQSVR